jgi:hypothetical protein
VQGLQGRREAGCEQRQGGAPGLSGSQVCVSSNDHQLTMTSTMCSCYEVWLASTGNYTYNTSCSLFTYQLA